MSTKDTLELPNNLQFRRRSRTLSPTIVRKLKEKRESRSRDNHSQLEPGLRCGSLSNLSPHDGKTRHGQQSMLVGILKNSLRNGDVSPCETEGKSVKIRLERSNSARTHREQALPAAHDYIDSCIRASQEALNIDRDPLPKGSNAFEEAMKDFDETHQTPDEIPKIKKTTNKKKPMTNHLYTGAGSAPTSPSQRRVQWRK